MRDGLSVRLMGGRRACGSVAKLLESHKQQSSELMLTGSADGLWVTYIEDVLVVFEICRSGRRGEMEVLEVGGMGIGKGGRKVEGGRWWMKVGSMGVYKAHDLPVVLVVRGNEAAEVGLYGGCVGWAKTRRFLLVLSKDKQVMDVLQVR